MDDQTIITKLTEIGGKLWERGDRRRIYFDIDLATQHAGLRCSLYNSGNVKSATLNGDAISNSEAKNMLAAVSGVKIYYDLTTGTFTIDDRYTNMSGYRWIARDYVAHLKSLIA